jgi:hypothetical protein
MQGPGVGEDWDTAPDAVPGPVWTSDAATGATSLQAGAGVGDALVMAPALAAGLAPAATIGDPVAFGAGDGGVAAGEVVVVPAGIADVAVVAVALAVAEDDAVGAPRAATAGDELALGSADGASAVRVGAVVVGAADF